MQKQGRYAGRCGGLAGALGLLLGAVPAWDLAKIAAVLATWRRSRGAIAGECES